MELSPTPQMVTQCSKRPSAKGQMTYCKRPLSNLVIKRPTAHRRPASFFMPILVKKGTLRMMRRPTGATKPHNGYTRIKVKKVPKSRLVGALGITSVTKCQSAQVVRRLLTKKGLMPMRKLCPYCGHAVRRGDYEKRCGDYGYRCSHRPCHSRINRLYGHSLFILSRHSLELAQQVAIMTSLLHSTTLANIHVQTGASHRAVEDMAHRLRQHLQRWVLDLVEVIHRFS